MNAESRSVVTTLFPFLRRMGGLGRRTAPGDASPLHLIVAPEALRGQFLVDALKQVAYVNNALKTDVPTLQWIADLRRSPRLQQLRVEWLPLSEVTERIAHDHHTGEDIDGLEDAENWQARAFDLLRWGADLGASDLHLRRQERYAVLEVSVDNVLLHAREYPINAADRLMRALYTACTSKNGTYRENIAQDGTLSGSSLRGTGLENVRVTRGPSAPISEGGHFLVARLQAVKGRVRDEARRMKLMSELRPIQGPPGALDLERKGWTARQSELLQTICLSSTGTLFFCGPPGSGKTNAIHDMSAHLARILSGQRQVFVEQPVELIAPWAIQLDIANTLTEKDAGEEFDAKTRQALRMETKMMTIGEIRDLRVALAWLRAARGGMFAMTTMHVPTPFEVPPRLRDMDKDRLDYPITCDTSIMAGFVAMRLVAVLCDHCALPWDAETDPRFPPLMRKAVTTWGSSLNRVRRKGKGCEHCAYTGYSGRQVVAEVVDADEELMADYIEFGSTRARHRHRARPDADSTMLEKAMELVFSSRMDPFDVRLVERIRARDALERERELGRTSRTRAGGAP